jgi:NAD kinase
MRAFVRMIVVVTQKTDLEELVERYNTRAQAEFYLEHASVPFAPYQAAHEAYVAALNRLREALPAGVRHQFVERSFLPNFLFGEGDLVAVLGRDGLVVNTAKYLAGQLLIGFNPDPERIDGVLVRVPVSQAATVFRRALAGEAVARDITMARAVLSDGQVLHAVNDLFIGRRTHVSARYRLGYRGADEDQSSSGIIVSTGAGSTGWLRSILTGAAGIVEAFTQQPSVGHVRQRYGFDWAADYLVFSVREPFISKASRAGLVFGPIAAGEELVVTSQMPQHGVIFSDGIETDYLEFNSGRIARVGVADKKVRLVVHR